MFLGLTKKRWIIFCFKNGYLFCEIVTNYIYFYLFANLCLGDEAPDDDFFFKQ